MFKEKKKREAELKIKREIERLTNIITTDVSDFQPEIYLGTDKLHGRDAVERVIVDISPEGKETCTIRLRDKIDAAEKLMKLLKI